MNPPLLDLVYATVVLNFIINRPAMLHIYLHVNYTVLVQTGSSIHGHASFQWNNTMLNSDPQGNREVNGAVNTGTVLHLSRI